MGLDFLSEQTVNNIGSIELLGDGREKSIIDERENALVLTCLFVEVPNAGLVGDHKCLLGLLSPPSIEDFFDEFGNIQ